MLREIYCDKFHQEQIVFNPGLSVVLGTNTGHIIQETPPICKSKISQQTSKSVGLQYILDS